MLMAVWEVSSRACMVYQHHLDNDGRAAMGQGLRLCRVDRERHGFAHLRLGRPHLSALPQIIRRALR